MNFQSISRVLGKLLALYSMTFLVPLAVAFIYQEDELLPYLVASLVTFATALILYLPSANNREIQPRIKDGYIIVVLYWVVLGVFGTIPFLLLQETSHESFTNVLFESFSGLTTTGATIFPNLDSLPRSILFYRQQLQWLGGMGLIILAMAVLPTLGVGGQILFKAEIASPLKDEKLSPRISSTAKALWSIYLTLTIVCAIAYRIAGMDWFDAIAHSFSTVSIGGFSTHDANIGYFNSPLIESIAMIFMLISAVNFALHFNTWHRRDLGSLKSYWLDTETRAFFYIIASMCLLAVLLLTFYDVFTFDKALRYGLFQTVSIITTTGFTNAEWYNWPGGIPWMLLYFSFVGACAGSTGGGMKVIRFLLLVKQGLREITMLVHPRAIHPLRLNHQVIPERIINTIWGFFALYVSVFLILLMLMLIVGESPITAFSALSSCINNLGPAMGDAHNNYASLSTAAKSILTFAMLVGRLEFYSLVIILTPIFWRT